MLNDSHIHVGQFREIYTSPRELVDFLDSVGVQRFAVSSTSIWLEDYNLVLSEIKELHSLAHDRVSPVLWISPAMFDNGGLDFFLQSDIAWQCVKVHGVHLWSGTGILKCVETARQLQVPLLFHTGGFEQCDAGVYLPIVKANPDVRFILAHARPIDQALVVMKACENAWADTAFTPIPAIRQLIDAGFSDRTLWGTDYPIARSYFPEEECPFRYKDKLQQLQQICTEKQFECITSSNYSRIFH